MSEFEPTPIEQPPVVEIKIDGLEMTLHWFNTTIFEHAEHYEQYDHIFVAGDDDSGIYLWRQNLENYDEVAGHLDDKEFPVVFKPYVAVFDVKQYDRMMAGLAERADEYLARWEYESREDS